MNRECRVPWKVVKNDITEHPRSPGSVQELELEKGKAHVIFSISISRPPFLPLLLVGPSFSPCEGIHMFSFHLFSFEREREHYMSTI